MKCSINKPLVLLVCGMVLTMGACSKKETSNKGDKGGVIIPPPSSKITYIDTLAPSVPLKHVGGLHTPEDFERIKAKVEAKAEPWYSGWNKLINNSHAQLTYTPHPTVKLIRGGNSPEEPEGDNYSNAMNDAAAAYQLGLRWKISGDNAYAQKAVSILNAWATTCEKLSGDPNVVLGAGFYGYEFAVAGELLRDYQGWNATDFKAYQNWMLKVFYPVNRDFLKDHMGVCITHCWANWDLSNLASMIGIALLTDNRSMYNYAVDYLQHSKGNGCWFIAINHVFDGENAGLAQLQESGRDQGHATLVISLMGLIAQLTWNQGDDFYGLDDNRLLKACEYTAKYNVARLEVPFQQYTRYYNANCAASETQTIISTEGRGTIRPMWSAPYFHYTKVKGVASTDIKYTALGVQTTLPEGGGGDYGPNSGGFDQLGFGTLMYSR